MKGVSLKGFMILCLTVFAMSSSVSGATQSDPLKTKDVIITNNARANDNIYVMGLAPGDEVYVYSYSDISSGKLLAKKTAGANKTDLTITLSQLGTDAGSVYLSVKTVGQTESARIRCYFTAEPATPAPFASDVAITNKSGSSDTIYVTNLRGKDIVKVYSNSADSRVLATGTVSSSKDNITLTCSQLGVTAGTVYISVTSVNMNESSRTVVGFSAENQTTAVSRNSITVTNNVGTSDTVYVESLTPKDVITVYDTAAKTKILGSATCATGKTSVSISISQLGSAAGKIYVSRKSAGLLESLCVEAEYAAEEITPNILAELAVVSNNVSGTKDTIFVSGLTEGDTVRAYTSESIATVLAQGTVAAGKTDVTLSVTQLGTKAGVIWLSNTGKNKTVSEKRTGITYEGEYTTDAPDPKYIVVTNNSGIADTVELSNCAEGAKVTVYRDAISNNILGSATATGSTTAKVSISQLGVTEGSVYVAVANPGSNESARTKADYSTEKQTGSIENSNIVVTNNVQGTSDTVKFTGLSEGTVVYVYNKSVGGTLLGSATVAANDTAAIVSISQLGQAAGSVYCSTKATGKSESERMEVKYSAEEASRTIDTSAVSITNNAKEADIIRVSGLTEADKVMAYSKESGGTSLGSATVASSETSVTITASQLSAEAGSVYISLTQKGKAEGTRVEVKYAAELPSDIVLAENIFVTNNAGIEDTILVTNRSSGDVINIYKTADLSVKAGTGTIAAGTTQVSVSVSQLGTGKGNIYVTVTSPGKLESAATQRDYDAESQSDLIDAAKVSIVNSSGIAATLTAVGLSGNDVVKVYDRAAAGTLLGSGTTAAYGSEVTCTLSALGTEAGVVYVSVTSRAKLESGRVAVAYSAKRVTGAPSEASIVIINNAGKADTVTVTGLNEKDVVSVYSEQTGGDLLGSATVATGDFEATASVPQLGANGGTVYVSVTSTGKLASARTDAAFIGETQTAAPLEGDIIVNNNSGVSDTVVVTGLLVNDVVKVYKDASDSTAIGTATAASTGAATTITVASLSAAGGTVYVTVRSEGKTESARTAVSYLAESKAPVANNITVTNNAVTADEVKVSGLAENDVVKIYTAASGGHLLGSASVSSGTSAVTVVIAQISTEAGSVYVSVTGYGLCESSRTKADYLAEQSSNSVYSGYVAITNNPEGTSDKVVVTQLAPNDTIRIYSAATGGELLGSATVSVGGNSVTISIKQLGQGAGSVYISVTNFGKNESARIKADFTAE